jgi:hypothetical protein
MEKARQPVRSISPLAPRVRRAVNGWFFTDWTDIFILFNYVDF